MRSAVLAVTVTTGLMLGCGQSLEERVTAYCEARLECHVGVEPVDECVEATMNPIATAEDQCATRELAACLGDCYDTGPSCAVFYLENACNCDEADDHCAP